MADIFIVELMVWLFNFTSTMNSIFRLTILIRGCAAAAVWPAVVTAARLSPRKGTEAWGIMVSFHAYCKQKIFFFTCLVFVLHWDSNSFYTAQDFISTDDISVGKSSKPVWGKFGGRNGRERETCLKELFYIICKEYF